MNEPTGDILTLDMLETRIREYKNTLVLDGFKVVMLLDVKDDGDDFYWVFDDGQSQYYSSCCLMVICLKGKIEENEYNALLGNWMSNKKFSQQCKDELETLKRTLKLGE